jgi:predicted cobalt transporter CbtA
VIVPPVPAPATTTSTRPDEGFAMVDGVETTASMISGPVVSSCTKGLFGCELRVIGKQGVEIEGADERFDIGQG